MTKSLGGPSHNQLRTCVPEVSIKGRDTQLCPTDILGYSYIPLPWHLLLADKSSIALLAITKLPFTCEIGFFTMVTVISILRKEMETLPRIVCLLRINHVQLESGAWVTLDSGWISSHITDRHCDITRRKAGTRNNVQWLGVRSNVETCSVYNQVSSQNRLIVFQSIPIQWNLPKIINIYGYPRRNRKITITCIYNEIVLWTTDQTALNVDDECRVLQDVLHVLLDRWASVEIEGCVIHTSWH